MRRTLFHVTPLFVGLTILTAGAFEAIAIDVPDVGSKCVMYCGGGGGGGGDREESPRNRRARERNDIGISLFNQKKWAQARAYFFEAGEILPTHWAPPWNVALSLWHEAYELNETDKARVLELLQKATEWMEKAHRLGASDARKQLTKLKQYLREAEADKWREIGVKFSDEGRYVKAEAAFKKYLELEESYLGYWDLAIIYSKQRRYTEARGSYATAVRLATDPEKRAELQRKLDDIEKTIRDQQAAAGARTRILRQIEAIGSSSTVDVRSTSGLQPMTSSAGEQLLALIRQ